MADIIKIKKDGVVQYPITKPECVIDENGKNVLQLIRENAGGDPYDDTEIKQDIANLKAKDKATDAQLVELSEKVENINPTPMVSVTYAELVALRDNGELVAGMQYRITDYVTTTAQENTRSAGHQFDVIVTADNENTLNEVARACRSEFDIEKYKDAYSTSWGETMLYVGQYEYEGKEYHLYESESHDMQMLIDFNNFSVLSQGNDVEYPYICYAAYYRIKEDTSWGDMLNPQDDGEVICFKHNPTVATYFNSSNLAAWQIWYSLNNDTERFAWADNENGKGVIYRMIDEWNNDCPYDFKNIQFLRGVYEGGGIAPDGDEDMHYYLFTFSFRTENNEIIDTSIFGNNGRLLNDEGQITGVYGNVIGQYMSYDGSIENPTKTAQRLNDIVFYSHYDYEMGTYYGCYSNSFGNGCYSNSFGNGCYSNSFGDGCYSNSFGNYCYFNSFGDGCSYNSFGNNCDSNSFGDGCNFNSLGHSCSANSFGENCYSNSFGNYCYSNSFGDGCNFNSLGNYCTSVELSENTSYKTASVNSNGEVKVFNLADLADLLNS